MNIISNTATIIFYYKICPYTFLPKSSRQIGVFVKTPWVHSQTKCVPFLFLFLNYFFQAKKYLQFAAYTDC
jgi:hypothetical protein